MLSFLSTCRSTGGDLLNGRLPVFTSSFDHSELFSNPYSHIHGCHITASGSVLGFSAWPLSTHMTPRWNQQPLYYRNDSFHRVIYSAHCRGLLKTPTAASSQVFRAPVRARTSAVPHLAAGKNRFALSFMIIRLNMTPLEGVTSATMIDTECKSNTKAITAAPASDRRPTGVGGRAVGARCSSFCVGHKVQLWRLNAFRIHICAW